jgi:8-oxo-dGTP pyrophosphatase MutT (NUDIX family)
MLGSMSLPLFDLPREARRAWIEAQLRRPPPFHATGMSDGFRMPGREGRATPAAVLVPIVDRPEGLTLLLTQRSEGLPDHPGQISFPGGRVEPDDRDVADAALREAHEEIGLDRTRVSLLGSLATYDTTTGFRVTPVVGWVTPPFDVVTDPVEVADVFEVPLAFLLDPRNHRYESAFHRGRLRRYWALPFGERFIWGATAGMLVTFHRVVAPPPAPA